MLESIKQANTEWEKWHVSQEIRKVRVVNFTLWKTVKKVPVYKPMYVHTLSYFGMDM